MGFLSDFKAMADVQRIKATGGTAKLSMSQITCLIVNMPDAQKNLNRERFQAVYALYLELRKCKTKMRLDIEGYYEVAVKIVKMFNALAPYELFCGGNEPEAKLLLEEIGAVAAEHTEETRREPETVQNFTAVPGYTAVYGDAVENTPPAPPELKREEPEQGGKEADADGDETDSVGLLMRIQAEEAEKRAAEAGDNETGPKKRKGAPVWSVVLLGTLCVALAAAAGVMGWNAQNAMRERDEALAGQKVLERRITSLEEEKGILENRVKRFGNEIDKLQQGNKELQREIDFWEEKTVVFQDPFTDRYYHRYDCALLDPNEFTYPASTIDVLYTWELLPCRRCNPPVFDSLGAREKIEELERK